MFSISNFQLLSWHALPQSGAPIVSNCMHPSQPSLVSLSLYAFFPLTLLSQLSIAMKNPIYNSTFLYYLDIQGVLDSFSDGQSKLDAVTQEGQTLYAHLPKQIVSSIQEQITKANEEFQAFLKQCLKDKQALQDCVSELGR